MDPRESTARVRRVGTPLRPARHFQACVIKPQKKNAKKIRDQLEHLFSGLNADAGGHHKSSNQADALAEARKTTTRTCSSI